MSQPQHARRASCLIAAVVLLGIPCILGSGLMGYVIYQEEVVEPKKRAADPEYAKRQDAERAKYKAEREEAARRNKAERDAKARASAAAQADAARASRERAKGDVTALTKRGGRPLLDVNLRTATPNPAPRPHDAIRPGAEGLTIRARRIDRAGLKHTLYALPQTGDVAVVLDIERFGSPYDQQEQDPLRILVGFPDRQLTIGMSYEQIYVTRGPRTEGFALSVPGRGRVRFGNDEPKQRTLRIELVDGQLSVWLNGHPQLQGRPMSTSTAGFRPKPWDPTLAKAPSRVEIGAWLDRHTTNTSYEQTVVLGAAHVLAMP